MAGWRLVFVALLLAGCSSAPSRGSAGPPGDATGTSTAVAAGTAARCRAVRPESAPALVVARRCTATTTPTAAKAAAPVSWTAVAFPDATHGWAAGQTCSSSTTCPAEIQATTDAGRRWTLEYRGQGELSGLDAYGDTRAWVISRSPGCDAGPGGTCRYSLLLWGAGSWSTAVTTSAVIEAVHFTDPATGYLAEALCRPDNSQAPQLCPGRILKTTDGGSRWSPDLATSGPLLALTSAGSQLWAVEGETGSSPFAGRVVVLTSRGGDDWRTLGFVTVEGAIDPSLVASINFSDARSGLLSLYDRSSCAMHGCGVADLYGTEDGGSTWNLQALPTYGPGCGWASIAFALAPGGTAYAAQSVNLATCLRNETLLSMGPGAWSVQHGFARQAVYDMAWPSSTDGWAADGELIHSTDSGSRWAQVLPAPRPAQAVSFSGAVGWGAGEAGVSDVVLNSRNGGRTWSVAAHLPGYVYEVVPDGPLVWAVTVDPDSGAWTLWRSADGGRSWSDVYSPSSSASPGPGAGPPLSGTTSILGLAVRGRIVALVTGTGSQGLRPVGPGPVRYRLSSDGGFQWSGGAGLPGSSIVESVSLCGPAHAWELDQDGNSVWATDNFGTTWSRLGSVPTDLSWKPLVLDRVGTSVGFILGGGRTGYSLLATIDAGRRWTEIDLPAAMSESLTAAGGGASIYFSSSAQGWIVTAGAVWRTADGGLSWSIQG